MLNDNKTSQELNPNGHNRAQSIPLLILSLFCLFMGVSPFTLAFQSNFNLTLHTVIMFDTDFIENATQKNQFVVLVGEKQ